MSVSYSYPLDFSRVDRFIDKWNQGFKIGDDDFEFVFASYSPTEIDECLNANGTLNMSAVSSIKKADATLVWDTNTKIVSLGNTVTVNYPLATQLKSVFLRVKGDNGFVLGYSIFQVPVPISNDVIIDEDSLIWSFTDGN